MNESFFSMRNKKKWINEWIGIQWKICFGFHRRKMHQLFGYDFQWNGAKNDY